MMSKICRPVFSALALFFLLQTAPAHASGFCIPLLTCPTTPADAPEINGAMLATGIALATSAGFMIRGRAKKSK